MDLHFKDINVNMTQKQMKRFQILGRTEACNLRINKFNNKYEQTDSANHSARPRKRVAQGKAEERPPPRLVQQKNNSLADAGEGDRQSADPLIFMSRIYDLK